MSSTQGDLALLGVRKVLEQPKEWVSEPDQEGACMCKGPEVRSMPSKLPQEGLRGRNTEGAG